MDTTPTQSAPSQEPLPKDRSPSTATPPNPPFMTTRRANRLRKRERDLAAEASMTMPRACEVFQHTAPYSSSDMRAAFHYMWDFFRKCGLDTDTFWLSSPGRRTTFDIVVEEGGLEKVSEVLVGTEGEWMRELVREGKRIVYSPDIGRGPRKRRDGSGDPPAVGGA